MIDLYEPPKLASPRTTGWRDFDYLIASAPDDCLFDITDGAYRIEMSPRGQWLLMDGNDALLIVMDDAKGLKLTASADLFEFTGDRLEFDEWMAAHHPGIGYRWLDQFAVGFADRAALQSFNDDLGERVLRAAPLPQAALPPSAPTL
jgi:hypothetical protein